MFIVGAPRSGTSILYRTLLKHSSFRVRGDEALQLAESALLEALPAAPRWKIPRPPRLWLFFLRDEAVYERFLDEVRSFTAGADPGTSGEPPPWTRPVLESFVRHATEARSCRRLLEKTPTHIDRAEWLVDALPGATLIYIHRHPLDTFTSYLRRARVDRSARAWADLSVDEFVEIYRRQSLHARRLAEDLPERFLTVGYERFTADPVSEMEKVCAFLSEPFEPQMVMETAPDLDRSANDPHLFGEITTGTKTWSDYLDRRLASEVEDRTRDIAKMWGYERRTPERA